MSVKSLLENEFEGAINNTEKKVIIDCYADWCGPCKMLAPVVEAVSEELTDCEFYKLNVDSAENIAMKYGIMSIPTILIFKNNTLQKQLVGFKSKGELEKEIKEV